MKRPKLKLNLSTIDYFVEIVGIVGLLCLIIIPIYYLKYLPDNLPNYFNELGQPDSFSGRGIIWAFPILGLILYIGLTILNQFPHIFNYPVEITDKNAERLYTICTRTIRLLKGLTTLTFSYLNFKIIKIGLQESTGLGVYFLPLFLTLCVIIVGLMIYKIIKK